MNVIHLNVIMARFKWTVLSLDVFTFLTVHNSDLYCFSYTSDENQLKSSGWDYFKLENEFKRLKVPNDNWAACHLNLNYEVSRSNKMD